MALITVEQLVDSLGLPFMTTVDERWAAEAVQAACAYVETLPIVRDTGAQTRADVRMGVLMLAAHLYHRRASGSVAPDFDAGGGPVGIDPIISRLLRIGVFAKAWVA